MKKKEKPAKNIKADKPMISPYFYLITFVTFVTALNIYFYQTSMAVDSNQTSSPAAMPSKTIKEEPKEVMDHPPDKKGELLLFKKDTTTYKLVWDYYSEGVDGALDSKYTRFNLNSPVSLQTETGKTVDIKPIYMSLESGDGKPDSIEITDKRPQEGIVVITHTGESTDANEAFILNVSTREKYTLWESSSYCDVIQPYTNNYLYICQNNDEKPAIMAYNFKTNTKTEVYTLESDQSFYCHIKETDPAPYRFEINMSQRILSFDVCKDTTQTNDPGEIEGKAIDIRKL